MRATGASPASPGLPRGRERAETRGMADPELFRAMPTLHTERLVLRPFAQTDAPRVQQLAGAFEIADTTLLVPHPYPDGAAETWIAMHEAEFLAGLRVNLAVTAREDGALLGAMGIGINREFARAELGYWIGLPFWRKGFCTEAGRAMLDYGFGVLGLQRIYAHHLVRNPASGRVLRKIGMQPEGMLRSHHVKWGRREDVQLLGVLREEWLLGAGAV